MVLRKVAGAVAVWTLATVAADAAAERPCIVDLAQLLLLGTDDYTKLLMALHVDSRMYSYAEDVGDIADEQSAATDDQ